MTFSQSASTFLVAICTLHSGVLPTFAQSNPRAGGSGDFVVTPLRTAPRVAWEARPGFRDFGPMASSAGVVVSGNINGGGGYFGFDAATGKKLWGVPGQAVGVPAVDSKTAYVVNAVNQLVQKLSAVDLKTGRILWSKQDEEMVTFETGVTLAGGRLYVAGKNGRLKALNAQTGAVLWELPFSPHSGHCPTLAAEANGRVYFGGGEVSYGGSAGRFLWAVDSASGRVAWKMPIKPDDSTDGECITAPVVGQGVVAVASGRALFALDGASGRLRWRQNGIRLGGEMKESDFSEPVISGGSVFAANEDGIGAWDLQSGSPRFGVAAPMQGGLNGARMAAGGGLLYAVTKDEQSSLLAIDQTSGAILWRHTTVRPTKYQTRWPARFILPVNDGLYYETALVLVKLQP